MRQTHKGFTLIESLIVMIILASSMTAALYLLSTVVFSTQQNIKRTKAVYLAQECTELARNLRDTAWATFRPWDCAFASSGSPYVISPSYSGTNTINSCENMSASTKLASVAGDNDTLWQVGATLTNFPGSAPDAINTGYQRYLEVVNKTSTEVELNCVVSWEFNGRPQSIEAPQTLTNWRKE